MLESNPNQPILVNISHICEGLDLGPVTKVWTKLAAGGQRLELLKNLKKLDIGLNVVEDNLSDLRLKFRSAEMKAKGNNSQSGRRVVREPMRLKQMDGRRTYQETITEVNQWRHKLKQTLGEHTWKYRSVIKYLKGEETQEREVCKEKNREKIDHLIEKHKTDEEDELDKVLDDLKDYGNLSVFDRGKFEIIEKETYEITTIGKVELKDDERGILMQHPQFALLDNLSAVNLDWDRELGFGKCRYELSKEIAEKLEDEGGGNIKIMDEEKTKMEQTEAKSRQVFDGEKKILDLRKQRVTDMEDNSRVTLPHPLPPNYEADIEMRRTVYKRLEGEYRRENCGDKGEQPSNLTKSEENGLKRLKKRIKAKEIVVMRTEKSNKFAVATFEKYIELGTPHFGKDREITMKEIIEREKFLNGGRVGGQGCLNY